MRPLSLTAPLTAPDCPLCGQPNACAASATGSFEVDCWCRSVEFPAAVLAAVPPERQGLACICRRCAQAAQGPGASPDAVA